MERDNGHKALCPLSRSQSPTLEDWGFKGADGTRGRYRLINDLATNKIRERDAR